MSELEYCIDCNGATGRAGRADDSFYCVECEHGPMCEDCAVFGDDVMCRKCAIAALLPPDHVVVRREDLRGMERLGRGMEGETIYSACPVCHSLEHRSHAPDCWLSKALEGDG